jgi:hypothetical protein
MLNVRPRLIVDALNRRIAQANTQVITASKKLKLPAVHDAIVVQRQWIEDLRDQYDTTPAQ